MITWEHIVPKLKLMPSGCIEWQGSRNVTGHYGRLGLNRKVYYIHREVYRLTFGEFDPSLLVCHTCDNPPCCNPMHLFLGTDKTNAEDRVRKGRQRSHLGANNPNYRDGRYCNKNELA